MKFNYDQMVNEIANEELALRALVKQLYPFMGYKKLQILDVRSIDLKEYLYSVEHDIPNGLESFKAATVDRYVFILCLYLEQIECQSGSRAERYKEYALKLAREATENTDDHYESDALLIMLSLYRSTSSEHDYKVEKAIQDLTVDATLEDFSLLKDICDNKTLIPTFETKEVEETGFFKKEKKYKTIKLSTEAIRWFQINSIMILCGVLLERGAFEEAEMQL